MKKKLLLLNNGGLIPWTMPNFTSNASTGGMSIQVIGTLDSVSPASTAYYPFSASGGPVCIHTPAGYLVTFDYEVEVSSFYGKAISGSWASAGGAVDIFTDVARTNKIATLDIGIYYNSEATAVLATPIRTKTIVFYGDASGQNAWNIQKLTIFGKRVI